MRAMMSVLAPAGNGTIKRMGRCGHSVSLAWATAAEAASRAAANMIEASRSIRAPRSRAAIRARLRRQCFDVAATRSRAAVDAGRAWEAFGLMCRGRIAVSAIRCVEVDFDNARKIAFLGGQKRLTITNGI